MSQHPRPRTQLTYTGPRALRIMDVIEPLLTTRRKAQMHEAREKYMNRPLRNRTKLPHNLNLSEWNLIEEDS